MSIPLSTYRQFTGSSCIVLGKPMGRPQGAHGQPKETPRTAHEQLLGIPRTSHGQLPDSPWTACTDSHGLPMVNRGPQAVRELSVGCLWDVRGILADCSRAVRAVSGLCVVCPWAVGGRFADCPCAAHGMPMRCLWLFMGCLPAVRGLSVLSVGFPRAARGLSVGCSWTV